MKVFYFLISIFYFLNYTHVLAQKNSKEVTIEPNDVTKIWDKAEHNAFTDLIRFNNAFYCTFREASGHVVNEGQKNGRVRVIKSTDGKKWTSVALLEKKGIDLRDPKLSITPKGRLMVIMGGSVYRNGEMMERIPQVAFSDVLGSTFTKPQKVIIDPDVQNSWDWIWRVTWNDEIGYAINWQLQNWQSGYPTGTIFLMKTKDGINYEKVSYLEVCGYPNESTIRFDENNKMYIVIRRERGDNNDGTGILATATTPYTKWVFQRLEEPGRLGGPNFIFLNKNRILLAARAYKKENGRSDRYTRLEVMDLEGNIKKTFILPSGGDNSYAGLAIHDKKVWVSYYSSHEGKTSIYSVQIPISDALAWNKSDIDEPANLIGKVALAYENDKYNFCGAIQKNPVNGNISSIWDSGNSHYKIKTPRDLHNVLCHTSSDGGKTYGSEVVVFQNEGNKISYTNPSSGYDLNGRLVCIATKVDQSGEFYPGNPYEMVAKYSDDDGRKWSPEYTIPGILPTWKIMNSNSNIIVLENGHLISNYYEGVNDSIVNLKCLRSIDNGKIWEVFSTIDTDVWSAEGEAINETSMIAIDNTTILAMTRVNGKSYYNQYLSADNGKSWTKQGNTSFGDVWPDNNVSSGYVHLIRISSFLLNNEKVISAYYFNRYKGLINNDAPFYVVYGKAEDLKNNGVSGWNQETRKEIVTSRNPLSRLDGYPHVIHPDNDLNAYGRFFDDKDNDLQDQTSIIYINIGSAHAEWLTNKLGIQQ